MPDRLTPISPFTSNARPTDVRIPLTSEFRFAHEPLDRTRHRGFVGRTAELDTLVQRILFSDGGSFLVTGYRGVGKTSFVGQVIRCLDQAMPWASSVIGDMEIVDVHLTIARPVLPAELMHHVIRRLHDRLAERGLLGRLDPELRERLALAYRRTSANMTRKLAETAGSTMGVSDLPLNLSFISPFKLALSRTRSRTRELSLGYLAYDDKAAEHDIIEIAQLLTRGYRRPDSWWSRLRHGGRPSGSSVKLKVVLVFDELDKLDDAPPAADRPARPYLDDLLHSLKNLFTTSGICFVFVAGKTCRSAGSRIWAAATASTRASSATTSTCRACGAMSVRSATDSSTGALRRRPITKRSSRTSSGISNIAAAASRDASFGHSTNMSSGTIAHICASRATTSVASASMPVLNSCSKSTRRGFPHEVEESSSTTYDKQRLGVYYLIDWILGRGDREFTTADVVKAARALSTKIALADESAADVVGEIVAVLEGGQYVERVPETLADARLGDIDSRKEALYRLTLQTRAQVGSAADGSQGTAADEVFAGRYSRLEVIGAGGMAVVYKAFDRVLGRSVAVKKLRGNLLSEPEAVERFQREALLLQRLRHPHIVEYLDSGIAGGESYIAMEFVDGLSLNNIVSVVGRVDAADAVAITLSVARGLEFVHGRNVVRNDIKPGNVLVSRGGRVVMVDFGIAKTWDPLAIADSDTVRGVVGTPQYMAPELIMGMPADARVDIYSLGIVLYEMLTGTRPFVGTTIFDTLTEHLEGTVVAPSLRAPVPAMLDAVVLKATARDPRSRFQTSTEMVAALAGLDVGPPDLVTLVSRARSVHVENVAREEHATAVAYVSALQLPDQQSPPTVIFDGPPPLLPEPVEAASTPALVVQDGPDAGKRFALPRRGESMSIGRAGASDIALSSTNLSRVHATVNCEADGHYSILDLNSRNGTFVNGASAVQPMPLRAGDVVQVADVTLRVR